ncbi:sugar nucleotide-binding protein [Porticoccaceae bacterium]|nr:sugar nucleotide-binding protein [Porticoccaceae bacterium]
MHNGLIGYTGFIGTNLDGPFDPHHRFNSKNIDFIKGMEFDHLIVAGAPGVKWYANQNPEDDLQSIKSLMLNLSEVTCNSVTLISTIDVYGNTQNVTEDDEPTPACKYGEHRLMLERFISDVFSDGLVVRLPGIFGHGLRKNVLFDFINKNQIDKIDSRSIFQFYSLQKLYKDILTAKKLNLKLLNITPAPTRVSDIYLKYFGSEFNNITSAPKKRYDVRSLYSEKFGGTKEGYFDTQEESLAEIIEFMGKNGVVAGLHQ